MTDEPKQRKYREGQWTPGQSGNPSGRPKTPEHVKEMLRALTEKAVLALEAALDGDDPKLRLTAAQEVLNRNLGRPHVTASVEVAAVDTRLAFLAALTEKALTAGAPEPLTIDATPVRKALPLPETPPASNWPVLPAMPVAPVEALLEAVTDPDSEPDD